MTEVILSILLAAASAFGVVFWRKNVGARAEARKQVDALRDGAREANRVREATVVANLESVEEEITEAGDDRKALADLINRG